MKVALIIELEDLQNCTMRSTLIFIKIFWVFRKYAGFDDYHQIAISDHVCVSKFWHL